MASTLRSMSILFAVVIAVALAGTGAQAQPGAGKGGGVCRADIQKFCKNMKPGAGRIRNCLEKHAAMLSPECKQHLAEAPRPNLTPGPGAKGGSWARPCMLDISKFCKDIPAGGGQVRACLERRIDALTPECKAALQPKGK